MLVAVLWILAALATLASIYSVYAVNTADGSHVGDDRVQAEASIRAGVEMAVFQTTRSSRKGQAVARRLRAARRAHQSGGRFRSEAARIDLNAAQEDLLAGLFAPRRRGVGPSDRSGAPRPTRRSRHRLAPTQANADAADAASPRAADKPMPKRRSRIPYPPRQAPFDNALELSLLPGVPEPVVERVLPFVTVFSGRPANRRRQRGPDGSLRAAGHDA